MTRKKPGCLELGCRGTHWEHGLCRKHFLATEAAERADRARFWRPQVQSYRAMHKELRKHRGSASWLPCVDCDRRADDWSYIGGAPDERVDNEGPFSSDPNYYVPRCSSCHVRYDKSKRKAVA